MPPAVLLKTESDPPEWWIEPLQAELPGLAVRVWPELGDAAEIDIALVWEVPPGAYARLPGLRAVLSLGFGVDHLVRRPDLPEGVPIARLHDPWMVARMSEYVLLHVLRYHRGQHRYEAAQRQTRWLSLPTPDPAATRVGVMGLGSIGRAAADVLAGLGFAVAGWSRTPHNLPGVACFAGPEGLEPFLARTDVLVCLLPLTPETTDLLDAATLAQLPRGARLINAARGGLLVEAHLLDALQSGQIEHATLDAFRQEPLPPLHAFWSHPQITVTPHAGSDSNPRTAAPVIAANIRRIRAGEPLAGAVDRRRGY